MSWDDEDDLYYDDFYQSHAPEAENDCEECGEPSFGKLCEGCQDDLGEYDESWHDFDYYDMRDDTRFADPGGNSALYAETHNNPRNLPCPTCLEPNRLTPRDKQHGYQCDTCADRAERGGY